MRLMVWLRLDPLGKTKCTAPSSALFSHSWMGSTVRSDSHDHCRLHPANTVISHTILCVCVCVCVCVSSALSGVFVLGATNRVENLDPALRRGGRFDREIFVPQPSTIARTLMLQQYAKMLTPSQCKHIAELCTYFSGAHIVCTHTHTHTHTHKQAHTHTQTSTHTQTNTHAHTHAHTTHTHTPHTNTTLSVCVCVCSVIS